MHIFFWEQEAPPALRGGADVEHGPPRVVRTPVDKTRQVIDNCLGATQRVHNHFSPATYIFYMTFVPRISVEGES